MAESVYEELKRKLQGCQNALEEANAQVKRYQAEVDILKQRESDLRKALGPFMITPHSRYEPHPGAPEYVPSAGEDRCR
jgi:predicted  nucleic acid-binding Zn-ribbon protein